MSAVPAKIVLGYLDADGWTRASLDLSVESRAEPEKKMPIITTFVATPDCLEVTAEDGLDNAVVATVAIKEGAVLPEDDRATLKVVADPAPGLGEALAAMPMAPGIAIPKPFARLSATVAVNLVPYWMKMEITLPGEGSEEPQTLRFDRETPTQQVSDGEAEVVLRVQVFRVDSFGMDQGEPLAGVQWSVKALAESDYFKPGKAEVVDGGSTCLVTAKSVQGAPLQVTGRADLRFRIQAQVAKKGKVWQDVTLRATAEQEVGDFLGWIGKQKGKYGYLTRLAGQASSEGDLAAQLGRMCRSELAELNRVLQGYEQYLANYVAQHPRVFDTAPGAVRNGLNLVSGDPFTRGCADMSEKGETAVKGTMIGMKSAFTVHHYSWQPGAARQSVIVWAPVAGVLLTKVVIGAKVGSLAGPWGTLVGVLAGAGAWLASHSTEHNMSCLQLGREPGVRIVLDPHSVQGGGPNSVHGPSHFQTFLTGAEVEGAQPVPPAPSPPPLAPTMRPAVPSAAPPPQR